MVPDAWVPTCTVVNAWSVPVAEIDFVIVCRVTVAAPNGAGSAFAVILQAARPAVAASTMERIVHLGHRFRAVRGLAGTAVSSSGRYWSSTPVRFIAFSYRIRR